MIARFNGGGGGTYSSSSSGDGFDLKTLGIIGVAAYVVYSTFM